MNGVLQSHMNGGRGLAAEITFDESNWYSISGGILSDTRVLANTFLAAPQKRRQGVLKIFLPKALILSVAQAGDGNNIGNIVSLCLTPGNNSLAADFCLPAGGGLVIDLSSQALRSCRITRITRSTLTARRVPGKVRLARGR